MIKELTTSASAQDLLSTPIAVLKEKVNGHDFLIEIHQNCDPDAIATDFVAKHHLPKQSSALVAANIKRVIREYNDSKSINASTAGHIEPGQSDFLTTLKNSADDQKGFRRAKTQEFSPRFQPQRSSFDERPALATQQSKESNRQNFTSHISAGLTEHTESAQQAEVLATLSIRIDPSKEADLTIMTDSDPDQLASSFVQAHNLPASAHEVLATKISDIIMTEGVGTEDDDDDDNGQDSAVSDLSASESGEASYFNHQHEEVNAVIEKKGDPAGELSNHTSTTAIADLTNPATAAATPALPAEEVKRHPLLSGFRQLSTAFKKMTSAELTDRQEGSALPPPVDPPRAVTVPPQLPSASGTSKLRANSSTTGGSTPRILAKLSIRIDPSKEADLTIMTDSDPDQLASSFVQAHNLPASAHEVLATKISDIIMTEGVGTEDDDDDDEVREGEDDDDNGQDSDGSSCTEDVATSATSSLGAKPAIAASANQDADMDRTSQTSPVKSAILGPVKSLSAYFGQRQPPRPTSPSEDALTAAPPPTSAKKSHAAPGPISPIPKVAPTSETHSLHSGGDSSAALRRKFSLSIKVSSDSHDTIVFDTEDSFLGVAALFVAKHQLPPTFIKLLATKMQSMIADDVSVRAESIKSGASSVPSVQQPHSRTRGDSDASRNAYNSAKQNWGRDGASASSQGTSLVSDHKERVDQGTKRNSYDTGHLRGRSETCSETRQAPFAKRRSSSANATSRRSAVAEGAVRTSIVVGQPTVRPRSTSPSGRRARTEACVRLYNDAALNTRRFEAFQKRVLEQKIKEQEAAARQIRKQSFAAKVGSMRQRSKSPSQARMNPGELLFEKGEEWLRTRERNCMRVRQSLEQDLEKELTFHPTVTCRRSPDATRTERVNGKSVANVYEALYEGGMLQLQKKLSLEEQRAQELKVVNKAEFAPKISGHSEMLAMKRRKKRFLGAAMAATPENESTEGRYLRQGPPGASKQHVGCVTATTAGVLPDEAESPACVRLESKSTPRTESEVSSLGRKQARGMRSSDRSRSSKRPQPSVLPMTHSQPHMCQANAQQESTARREERPQRQEREAAAVGKRRSASADAAMRNKKKPSIFDQLYADRKINERVLERSSRLHAFQSDFSPRTRTRRNQVDSGEHVAERLYGFRLRKEALQKQLVEEENIRVLGRDPTEDKKLHMKDIDNMLKRFDDCEAKSKEREARRHKECADRDAVCVPTLKERNPISDHIAANKRRSALSEIFTVLLYTVDMAREQEVQERRDRDQLGLNLQGARQKAAAREEACSDKEWRMVKERGEDVYEICPRGSKDSASYDSVISRAMDQALREAGDSVSDTAVTKNLMHVFDSAQSSPPPPPPGPLSGNKYYFRAEGIAKNKREAARSKLLAIDEGDSPPPPPTVRIHSAEDFDLDKARSGSDASDICDDALPMAGQTSPKKPHKEWPNPRKSSGRLLDTSEANAELLRPEVLRGVVAMVLETCRPSLISQDEFVECFEVLIESGLAPPLNMILNRPESARRTKRQLSSEEREFVKECSGVPRLDQGKRAVRLRNKASLPSTDLHVEHLLQYRSDVERKRQQTMKELEAQRRKELTYQPTLYSKKVSDKLLAKLKKRCDHQKQQSHKGDVRNGEGETKSLDDSIIYMEW